MRQAFLKFCTIIGILVVAVTLFALVMAFVGRFKKPGVASHTVLELALDRIPEDTGEDPFALLTGRGRAATLKDHVDAIEKAGRDAHVDGILIKLGAAPVGIAQMQELRDALAAFQARKKFVYVYSESFQGIGNYYLASLADRIFLLPTGDASVIGLFADSVFFRGALDKLGVTPHIEGRYEYKNAANQYMERKFTDAHREATDKLIGGIYAQIVQGIATGRKLTPEQVKSIIDKAPYNGKETVAAKLVDELAYRDEVREKAKAKAGSGAVFLPLDDYLDRVGAPNTSGPAVALVYGLGAITQGKSSVDPLGGDSSMGSDTVSAALRQAIDDKDVKAIVFRVDSPGGSAVASDAIAREVQRARKAGKPVVVSMGSVAASGGYWVSMDADKIVAQPGTITGSIGVLSGKMVTKGLWDKLGITFDGLKYGQNSTMFDGGQDFTPTELERFRAGLDFIYDTFTSRVAAGRKMKKEDVHLIAKGRVWSGEDAKARGLVDELGGLNKALEVAKKLAKITAAEVNFKQYPRRKTPFESLVARLADKDQDDVREQLRPLVQELRRAGLLARPAGEVLMPELRLRY